MRPVFGSKVRHGAVLGLRPGPLVAGFVATIAIATTAHAAIFQEGRIKNCAGETCTLSLTVPAPGKTLRVQHVSCRLRTSTPASQAIVQLFDGVNAVFVPTAVQDNGARRAFVANSPVTYFTVGGRPFFTIEAVLGAPINSEFACTVTARPSEPSAANRGRSHQGSTGPAVVAVCGRGSRLQRRLPNAGRRRRGVVAFGFPQRRGGLGVCGRVPDAKARRGIEVVLGGRAGGIVAQVVRRGLTSAHRIEPPVLEVVDGADRLDQGRIVGHGQQRRPGSRGHPRAAARSRGRRSRRRGSRWARRRPGPVGGATAPGRPRRAAARRGTGPRHGGMRSARQRSRAVPGRARPLRARPVGRRTSS